MAATVGTAGAAALGDTAPSAPTGQQVIDTLVALVLAYGSAVSASRWDLASLYLAQFQGEWSVYGQLAKRYALDHGAALDSVNAIPDDLAADGVLGTNTAKVISASLLLLYGSAGLSAASNTPTNVSGVVTWFARQVAPLAAPADGHWAIWYATRSASAGDIANDLVGQVTNAYLTGGATGLAHFTASPVTNPPPPNTSPGTGSAPVPQSTPLPTPTTAAQQPVLVTGATAQIPWWGWALGVTVVVGLVGGLGYYAVKKRPDLFRSRAGKRRRRR